MGKSKHTIHLKLTENPIVHHSINAYEKGSFYCFQVSPGKFIKYPIADIWRLIEEFDEANPEMPSRHGEEYVRDGMTNKANYED